MPNQDSMVRRAVDALFARIEGDDASKGGVGTLLVALSGGIDSTVLLHILRFHYPHPVTAAHVDHGMRADSLDAAAWCRGVCGAWDVPYLSERLREPPANEAEARQERYAFLERARASTDASWIVTAHHADDQAETVLFRIARGTGIRGLRGMPPMSHSRKLLRPLLSVWREDLQGYATRYRVPHRLDPSNLSERHARNVLRHRILPALEEGVAAGTKRSLVRLSEIAAREETAWTELLEPISDSVVLDRNAVQVVVARSELLAYPAGVQTRLLRSLLQSFGHVADEAGTGAIMRFAREGSSGSVIDVGGGVTLRRSFDTLVLERLKSPSMTDGGDALRIVEDEANQGRAPFSMGSTKRIVEWRVRGRAKDVAARQLEDAVGGTSALDLDSLRFPLHVRGWKAGDRIRLAYGRKKIKKVLAEARIDRVQREGWPVVTDREGDVLAVVGVVTAASAQPREGSDVLSFTITDDTDD